MSLDIYFAKNQVSLVRELAIGMGPGTFAHIGKDGTAYGRFRDLLLGERSGHGWLATEIKTEAPASDLKWR